MATAGRPFGHRGDGERHGRADHLDRRHAAQEPEAERRDRRSRARRRRAGRPCGRAAARAASLAVAVSATSARTRPISVSRPVPTTTAIPEPSATTVAANTILSRSGNGRVGTADQRRDLHRRHALAGQGRLVDAQVIDLDEPRVGGDRVAGLEEHDVARHQLVSGHHDLLRRLRRTKRRRQAAVLERGEDTLDPTLGDVADDAVGADHRADDDRVDHGAHAERQHGRGAEQEHGQRGQMAGDDLERGLRRRRGQAVLAERREPPRDFVRGEPGVWIRAELPSDGRRRQRVPDAVDSRRARDSSWLARGAPLRASPAWRATAVDQRSELQLSGVEEDEDVPGRRARVRLADAMSAGEARLELGRVHGPACGCPRRASARGREP